MLAQVQQIPSRANTTAALVARWLHGKSPHTQKAYEGDIRAFAAFVSNLPIEQTKLNDLDLSNLTIDDLQDFESEMWIRGLSPTTVHRKLATLKSLLSFAYRCGWTTMNLGVTVDLPKLEDKLAQRIISPEDVAKIISLETNPRNKLMLRFLYGTGCRAEELSGLKWKNIRKSGENGKASIYGKGGKTRHVVLPRQLYLDLLEYKGQANEDDAVFQSRKKNSSRKGHLSHKQIWEIVKKASLRAGVEASPHWFRHSHGTHSLENGAPVQLVKETLGHANVATTSKYLHANPSESSGLYLDL